MAGIRDYFHIWGWGAAEPRGHSDSDEDRRLGLCSFAMSNSGSM